MSEWFFRSNRPGYPHPVSSELENSGIRVAVVDCSVTERRRWRPPYQTGKTVHVHAKHYKHNEDGRTAPGVSGNGSVPLSHSGNVVTRIRIHTHTENKTEHNPPRCRDHMILKQKKIPQYLWENDFHFKSFKPDFNLIKCTDPTVMSSVLSEVQWKLPSYQTTSKQLSNSQESSLIWIVLVTGNGICCRKRIWLRGTCNFLKSKSALVDLRLPNFLLSIEIFCF